MMGISEPSGVSYIRTNYDKYNPKDGGEIAVKSSKVSAFSKRMREQGYAFDGSQRLSAEDASRYLRALNGIMPKFVEYRPFIEKGHEYKLNNRNEALQVYDMTDKQEIVGIYSKSIFNE